MVILWNWRPKKNSTGVTSSHWRGLDQPFVTTIARITTGMVNAAAPMKFRSWVRSSSLNRSVTSTRPCSGTTSCMS